MTARPLRPGGLKPIMSALKRFKLERDSMNGKMHPKLPKDFQTVHAVEDVSFIRRSRERSQDPYFLEGPDEYRAALCGAKVKVVLAVQFCSTDRQACPSCASELEKIKHRYDALAKAAQQERKLASNYKSVKL